MSKRLFFFGAAKFVFFQKPVANMSLAPQLDAAALGQPSPDGTPVMALPPRVPPSKAPKRKPTHATRTSSEPRNLADDTWLNDSTSNRSLGRVLKVISSSNGALIITDNCRVRVDSKLVARQGRDVTRLSVYAHQMSIDDMPID